VAIRSLCIDQAGQAVLGVGSGVVVDSTSDAEYDECLLKARFVTAGAG
jgi:anthranilate/para-aminobenzoate synthase component I